MTDQPRTTLATCADCGDTMESFSTVEVELPNGTTIQLLLCDRCAPDLWDDAPPGEWVIVGSSARKEQEVRRAFWPCEICDSVNPWELTQLLIDLEELDPDAPRAKLPTELLVCSSCTSKEPDRFRTREQLDL